MSTEAAFVPNAVPVLHSSRVQEVESSASARGYAAGYAAGARAAQEGVDRLRASLEEEHARRAAEQVESIRRTVTLLHEAVRALAGRTVPVVEAAQDAVLGGALGLAEAIVGLQLTDRAHAAHAALARVTSTLEGAVVEVRLHPEDVRLLTEAGVEEPALVPDATLRRGDAVAELEHGFLDARIGTAVERARAELAVLVEVAQRSEGAGLDEAAGRRAADARPDARRVGA
ncbi:FliH/SctL family protein [Oerskovia jenensis]|uniref:Flagellar assembly protein FliH n=1 Tax=Oerskovia jenensis TaxID=162169 RepID=A0ABS2LDI4_9CELL|nr:FliH/SctL family protein [Oerskovia jenensis]MBM7478470.1 flagellar assembly protein FliH [Oerskovia jenensis]